MKTRALPSQSVLHTLLQYDSATGKLYWRKRDMTYFTREQDMLMWNNRFSGKEAMTTIDKNGYRRGALLSESCLAHRVIYKMLHNSEPEQVDHDDRNPGNNRPWNLIGKDAQGNSRNSKLYSNNTSGVAGVHWDKARSSWLAAIIVGGKQLHLGRFTNKQDAIDARKQAEQQHNFHVNHGK